MCDIELAAAAAVARLPPQPRSCTKAELQYPDMN